MNIPSLEIFYPGSETLCAIKEGMDVIRVVQQGDMRSLLMGYGLAHMHGSISVSDPTKLVNQFSQKFMQTFRFVPAPQNILVVGLGVGSVPMAMAKHVVDAKIEVLEISPVIHKLAREYFMFNDLSGNITTTIGDAFITIQSIEKESLDMVLLDGFGTSYIPIQLMCSEFMKFVKRALKSRAVVAVNLLRHHVSFNRHMKSMIDAFGDDIYLMECGNGITNSMIFFSIGGLKPKFPLSFDDQNATPIPYPDKQSFAGEKPFTLGG